MKQASSQTLARSIFGAVKSILEKLLSKGEKDDSNTKEAVKPIHPAAKYVFRRTEGTAFALVRRTGKHLFELETVHFSPNIFPLVSSHIMSDSERRTITLLTFLPELERRACGTYGTHAMLVELSRDDNELTVMLFENMGIYQTELLQRWNVNKLVTAVEIKPLLNMKAERHGKKKCPDTNVHVYALCKSFIKLLPLRSRTGEMGIARHV